MKRKLLKSDNKNKISGFTLIELLVVIAIIGILSAVVIASLNSAREKGKVATIKSTLKNMQSEAEIYYSDNGNYSTVTNGGLDKFITSINNLGGVAKYYSLDGKRWGASATLNLDSTKNYSVSPTGVVVWDTSEQGYLTWDNSNNACLSLGRRLPSVEEFRSLYLAWNGIPGGFLNNTYWTETTDPLDDGKAYYVNAGGFAAVSYSKEGKFWARCVR